MVFTGSVMLTGIVLLLGIWVAIITVMLWRTRAHYNKLTEGITKHDLGAVLEKIIKRQQELGSKSDEAETAIRALAKDGAQHMSRIGLVRFNPFLDTGGSQSFTLALLDSKNNGLVMTSLYARTGNRWYVKEIRLGKGKGIELSKEEVAAITRAQSIEE
jgi:hypothetical protein